MMRGRGWRSILFVLEVLVRVVMAAEVSLVLCWTRGRMVAVLASNRGLVVVLSLRWQSRRLF